MRKMRNLREVSVEDLVGAKPEWRFTSKEFDDRFGTRFSRKWRMPAGRSEHEMHELVHVSPYKLYVEQGGEYTFQQKEVLEMVYLTLVGLNPEMRNHSWCDGNLFGTMSNVVYGMLSKFDRDDIFEFLEMRDWRTKLSKLRRLQRQNGFSVAGWVPSVAKLAAMKRMFRGDIRSYIRK